MAGATGLWTPASRHCRWTHFRTPLLAGARAVRGSHGQQVQTNVWRVLRARRALLDQCPIAGIAALWHDSANFVPSNGQEARLTGCLRRKEKTMANAKTPNILIIWGDDIGTSNLSIFTKGLMGYRTPHIDR